MMFKVAIYSRVSTSHHDQNPDVQVHELRKFCESRGWTVSEEIIDYASGSTANREGLKRLFSLADAREIDCIVVTKLDRLFRSLRQLVTTLDDLQEKGIAFVAVKDSIDYTTPSGRLFTQILASLAEFERSMIRERTMAGLEYAKTVKGKLLGRPKGVRNIELIRHLREQGMTFRQIGQMVGCSAATALRQLKCVSK